MLNLGLSGVRQEENGIFGLRGGCNDSGGIGRCCLSQVKERPEFEMLKDDEIPGSLAVSPVG